MWAMLSFVSITYAWLSVWPESTVTRLTTSSKASKRILWLRYHWSWGGETVKLFEVEGSERCLGHFYFGLKKKNKEQKKKKTQDTLKSASGVSYTLYCQRRTEIWLILMILFRNLFFFSPTYQMDLISHSFKVWSCWRIFILFPRVIT